MKHLPSLILLTLFLASGCTSQQKLAYLSNLPETDGEELFTMEIPDYVIHHYFHDFRSPDDDITTH